MSTFQEGRIPALAAALRFSTARRRWDRAGRFALATLPDSLPDNATWIANTASDMTDVVSASCNLVFSGQNIEHMWSEEVGGSSLSPAPVLRPSRYLVVDSPNRGAQVVITALTKSP